MYINSSFHPGTAVIYNAMLNIEIFRFIASSQHFDKVEQTSPHVPKWLCCLNYPEVSGWGGNSKLKQNMYHSTYYIYLLLMVATSSYIHQICCPDPFLLLAISQPHLRGSQRLSCILVVGNFNSLSSLVVASDAMRCTS